jgi:hypothetical protein
LSFGLFLLFSKSSVYSSWFVFERLKKSFLTVFWLNEQRRPDPLRRHDRRRKQSSSWARIWKYNNLIETCFAQGKLNIASHLLRKAFNPAVFSRHTLEFWKNYVPHQCAPFEKKLYPTSTPFETFCTPFDILGVGNPVYNSQFKWFSLRFNRSSNQYFQYGKVLFSPSLKILDCGQINKIILAKHLRIYYKKWSILFCSLFISFAEY